MRESGIWAKAGVTFDPLTQMLYIGTGNGLFSPSQNAWGDSILKVDAQLHINDHFTPYDWSFLQCKDQDVSAGGIMNVLWIVGLTALVLLEKLSPPGRTLPFVVGAGLSAAGVWLIATSGLVQSFV